VAVRLEPVLGHLNKVLVAVRLEPVLEDLVFTKHKAYF
jgi:hypothetical protein